MRKREKRQPQEKLPLVEVIIRIIVRRRAAVEKVFAVLTVLSLMWMLLVNTNYDLTEYLPAWSPSKQGIDLMEQEFGYPGTARVMIENVSVYEAKAYKDAISALSGVDTVSWADTAGEIYTSRAFLEQQDLDDYYKDGCALMDVQFTQGDADPQTYAALDEIAAMLGERGHLSGPSVDNNALGTTLNGEIPKIMSLGVVMILAILAYTTTSWFEPVLFMFTMGIAIVLNMGTNLIFGSISFLSASVAALLQLAVAMDYSIFLLHTFTAQRAQGLDIEGAMESALRLAISSILSSGATTIIGFLALALMRFTIGRDLGFVLAKGIVCSLVTVLLLMPALIIRWHGLIERFGHRSFVPSLQPLAKLMYQCRKPVAAAVLIVIVPCYVAQGMIHFMYGSAAVSGGPGSKSYVDKQAISATFGENNMLLAIVPNQSSVIEKQLCEELDALPYVRNVTALAHTMPEGIPERFLPESLTTQLHTENYARVLMNLRCDDESERAFGYVEEIRGIVNRYYPDGTHLVGTLTATQDMKNIISEDYGWVNMVSILGVALVILLTFQSPAMALVVIIPIEVAVYINTALPYFSGSQLAFLGFLMVSSMQLGATVDYSILITNNYLNIRVTEQDKNAAAVEAIRQSALSVLTSGSVLTLVGYALYYMLPVAAIADMGHLIGRGAFLSMIFVFTLLPLLLTLFDRLIFNDRRLAAQLKKLDLHRALVESRTRMRKNVRLRLRGAALPKRLPPAKPGKDADKAPQQPANEEVTQ